MKTKAEFEGMETSQIVDSLEREGVVFSLDAGNIRLNSDSPEALNSQAVSEIRERKPEVVSYLEKRLFSKKPVFQGTRVGKLKNRKTESPAACGSPDCAGCYEMGDGRLLHPPKSEWTN